MKFEPTYFTEMGATGTDTELEVAFGVDVSLTTAPPPKYAWTSNKTFTGADDIASNDEVNGSFYMPKESDADGETTATGDRLNNGDEIKLAAGAGTPDYLQADPIKLKLGATTLAAGAAVLAATLAF